MTYLLFATAIVGGFFFRKSHIISAYIVVVMLILSVYKYNVADLDNYKAEYVEILANSNVNIRYFGHYLFTYVCSYFELTFEQYLFVYYALILALMYAAIFRFKTDINGVLSLYLIYPFGIDVIQMKTMMANAWVLLGLSFLIQIGNQKKNDNRRNIISFLICSIIGSLFHFSVSFFIPVCFFLVFVNIEKIKKYMFTVVITLFFAVYLNIIPKLLILVCDNLHIGDADYMIRWLVRKTHMGWLYPTTAILICIICSVLLGDDKHRWIWERGAFLSRKYLIYSACFLLPFFLYDVTFIRLLRVYVILIYIYSMKREIHVVKNFGIIYMKTRITEKRAAVILTLLALMGYIYWYEIYPNNLDTLGGILRYNSIL